MNETLWGLTTFFNPTGAESRKENFRRFRARSRAQGLPLLAVELVFGDAHFELRPGIDADIVIQRRSDSLLWQKERLLNIGLANLPSEAKNVCWADADVLFEDDNWARETENLLQDYVVVQPYSRCIRLPRGAFVQDFPGSELDKSIPLGTDEGTYSSSVCSQMTGFRPRFSGTTGYAWCARREFLEEVGFYDRCIVGGADREMALAMLYPPGRIPDAKTKIRHEPLRRHILQWHQRVYPLVARRVGYRKGVIHHLWHGASAQRNYSDRHDILARHAFDPASDLVLDEGGCFRFRGENQSLVAAIGSYFASRREDG